MSATTTVTISRTSVLHLRGAPPEAKRLNWEDIKNIAALEERDKRQIERAEAQFKKDPVKGYLLLILIMRGVQERMGGCTTSEIFSCEDEVTSLLQPLLPPGQTVEDKIASLQGAKDLFTRIITRLNGIANAYEEMIAELYREAAEVEAEISVTVTMNRARFLALYQAREKRIEVLNKKSGELRAEVGHMIDKAMSMSEALDKVLDETKAARERFEEAAERVSGLMKRVHG